jgi:hypothetical protein
MVDLRPCLNKSPLPSRKVSSDEVNSLDVEDPHAALILRMKMRGMMWSARFGKHPYHDTKESGYFRHHSLQTLFSDPILPTHRSTQQDV